MALAAAQPTAGRFVSAESSGEAASDAKATLLILPGLNVASVYWMYKELWEPLLKTGLYNVILYEYPNSGYSW